ncbi:MAG: hypothetical protein HY908_12150 [Myxococcales bacterium]|nr:hypothetical protein [Myxococcales bacterium]
MSEVDWGTWASERTRKHTRGMDVPVEARLAWIEEMLVIALERGAIPKRRDEWGQPLDGAAWRERRPR